MKKIIFSFLFIIVCLSLQNISAAILKSNTIKNNTDAPISVILKRDIDCFGKIQTGTVFSRLEEGQTGLVFLSVADETPSCTSHVTELRAMQGLNVATITNPNGITAKDYIVSLKTTSIPGQESQEELVIE